LGRDEDAIFTAGLVQGQWAQRFVELGGLELIARGDLQVASDPLLSLEQFSLAGYASVRGYRENEVIRDNGFATSLEFRFPLLRRPDGRTILQFGPFVDVGHAWNDSGRPAVDSKTLASVGLGLRATPWTWLRGELYWGQPLTSKRNGRSGAQDSGFHFSLSAIQRW
jgi:hemolysin activation/secretion protein